MSSLNEPSRAQVGPYRLLRKLGGGGMGETYEARSETGQNVCLKLMRGELLDDARYVRMFQDEARIHAQLRHENIVRVLDSGTDQGTPYLVLELIDGMSLDAVLAFLANRGERAPTAASAHILLALAAALETAHNFVLGGRAQQLVHRDISPSNVLISRDGDVKLTDFGIAKDLSRTMHTTAGVVRGKFAYMSPEQTRGEPLDQRSDLFALGVVAYELFAGVHPFRVGRGENEVMTAHRMLLDERVPLGERAPFLPVDLRAETERLLEREPVSRPRNTRAFVAALKDLTAEGEGQMLLQRLMSRALLWQTQAGAPTHDLQLTPEEERLRARPSPAPAPVALANKLPSRPPPAEKRTMSFVQKYLAELPTGLDSYPSCQAKGSLVRAYLGSRPLVSSPALPAPLQELITHPPVSGSWIPEVHFLALALLVREQHFESDQAFLAWVKELNAELFRGRLYRALMLVSSTRLLAAGAGLRWRQFHNGTTLTAHHDKGNAMDLHFALPTGLFLPLHLRLFASAIEAAIEAAGGSNARTEFAELKARGAHVRIVW